MQLIGHEYIKQTRAYCDYLEEHFIHIAKAFEEVTEACRTSTYFANEGNYKLLWQAIRLHDVSKFSAYEFTQYRDKFFPTTDSVQYSPDYAFIQAWKHHYINNTHHWESAQTQTDVVHMVIDWTAMSYKFGGTAQSYYEANLHKIKLNPTLIPFLYEIFNYIKDSHEHTNQHVTGTAEQSTYISKWPDIYEQH